MHDLLKNINMYLEPADRSFSPDVFYFRVGVEIWVFLYFHFVLKYMRSFSGIRVNFSLSFCLHIFSYIYHKLRKDKLFFRTFDSKCFKIQCCHEKDIYLVGLIEIIFRLLLYKAVRGSTVWFTLNEGC